MPDNARLFVERTSLRTLLLSFVLAASGLIAIAISHYAGSRSFHAAEAVLREAGAVLFVSGSFAALWEFVGKRAFADEVLAKAGMSRDLADAGIEIVTASFQDGRIRWDELFKNACKLDIFVAYASTWRNAQIQRIDKLLSDPSARLRIVLPDPEFPEIIQILADRFQTTPEHARAEIEEARVFFEQRRSAAKGTVEIYFSKFIPLFTFYRFNNKAIFALYNHREGRIPVPTVVCDEGGFLFEYLTNEFEGIVGNVQNTRRIDTEPSAR